MSRIWGRLIVGFVLCLIGFIAYSSQIFIIWPWYGHELSVELLVLLIPFNIFVGMLLWNYYLCVTTDPGRVPASWRPDTQSGDGYEVKKLTGGPRFCRTCEEYKPPRSHHCRQCGRCVLRMDHHCPWVNNCVGHFNYGHFIRFLFYVDVSCICHVAMVTSRVFSSMRQHYWDEPSGIELVFIILNYTACIPVLLAVGAFSIYHFYSLSGNTTTIEGWEKDKAAILVRRGKIEEIKFPYNLGTRRNVESVLGPNPLLWCWPGNTPGTGLKYEIVGGSEPDEIWPPRDPTRDEKEDDPNHKLELPTTPWTYQDGTFNPELAPSNTRLRSRRRIQRSKCNISSVPPYHPDYNGDTLESSSSMSDSDSDPYYEEEPKARKIRRGSEGYEVRAPDREKMLRRYIEGLGDEEGRYNIYVPEPDVDSESDGESEQVPLGERVEKWRAGTS